MKYLLAIHWCLALALTSWSVSADEVDVPLALTASGGLEIDVIVAGMHEPFLVDTGAALATINTAVYKQLHRAKALTRVREVAGRMADGRTRLLTVYSTSALQIAGACGQSTVELIHIPGKGRNLLGMNVLREYAPLTFTMVPPSLSVSGCVDQLASVGSDF